MANIEKRGASSWRVQWRYGGTAKGARQSRTYTRRADAATLARRVEELGHLVMASDPDVQDGSILGSGWRDRRSRRDTFGGLTWGEWREDFAARRQVRGHSVYNQASTARRWLTAWDDVPLRNLGQADVIALVRRIEGEGRDARASLQLARTIFTDAIVKGQHPGPNPCAGVRIREPDAVALYLSPDEVDALLLAATPRMRLLVRLGVECGLRRGEILALQAGDLGDGRVRVRRTVTRDENGRHAIGPPKTHNGRREVPAPPDLIRDLRVHARFSEENPRGWIFPGATPAAEDGCQRSGTLNGAWTSLREASGVERRVRIHDLRHTYASRLIEEGVPLLTVSRMLGHGSVSITERTYGHLSDRSDDLVLEALARVHARNRAAASGLRVIEGGEA